MTAFIFSFLEFASSILAHTTEFFLFVLSMDHVLECVLCNMQEDLEFLLHFNGRRRAPQTISFSQIT